MEKKHLRIAALILLCSFLLCASVSADGEKRAVPLEGARFGITSIVAQDYLSGEYPAARFFMYPAAADAVLALQSGIIDYVMTSQSTAGYMRKSDATLRIVGESTVNEACYIAVSKNNPTLKSRIDSVISNLKADGTLSELCGRWALDGPDYYRTKDIEPSGGANGTLKVAISPDVPPICFVLDTRAVGINIELIEIIAKELDMRAEFFTMDFDALLPAITSGKVDVAISDINATDERRKLVDFTQSYFDNPQVLVTCGTANSVPLEVIPEYTHLSQLSGKTVALMVGTVMDMQLGSVVSDVKFNYYNTFTDTLEALKTNKVDSTLADEPVAMLSIAQNPGLTIIPERVVEDHYGIALQKNSPLTPKVNAAIAALRESGMLKEMKDKWTSAENSAKVLPVFDYIPENGTLRVANDVSFEPMTYLGTNGTPLGYDLELMLRIGEILKMDVEFTTTDFTALMPALQSGKVDAAVGCLSITDERKETVDMSDACYDGGLYCMVRREQGTAAAEKASFFESLKASFVRTFITENRWMLVLDGLWITLIISIFSGIFGTLLGFAICMLRRSKSRFKAIPSAVFIWLIQGTPIVLLLMILYYLVFGSIDIPAIVVAIIGFSINFAAYVSEMMRTGIEAVEKGQSEAALALGFSRMKAFWKVTFPQAARHFLPVFKGEFVSMVKMTSIVGYIALQDLTKVSDIIRSRTLEAFFPLIATTVVYFVIANILTFAISRIEFNLDPKRRSLTIKKLIGE